MLRAPSHGFTALGAMSDPRRRISRPARPYPPRHRGAKRPKSFVGEVMRAAKKAGHTGKRFGASRRQQGTVDLRAGRRAALSLHRAPPGASSSWPRSSAIRAALPLGAARQAIAYLKREGVTRDGGTRGCSMRIGDGGRAKAFAERCENDRHHFRFTISPEDAAEMADLRTFTRELMADAETRSRNQARLGRGRSLEHR